MQVKKPHVPLSGMHELVMNQDSIHFSQMFLALSSALVRGKAKNVPFFHQHPLVYSLELGETPFMCTFVSCTTIINYALPPFKTISYAHAENVRICKVQVMDLARHY